MKTLTVAAVLLAVLVVPAEAQMGKPGGSVERPKTEDKTPKVDEKAYKDALKRIPDSKEKYDPWSGARPATDPKTK